jgi:enoyl-CoA hydratase/carnithine racemase
MSVLIVDVADHVAVVTLNRPSARNALNPELIVELDRCWQELRDNGAVRAVVLTGAAGSTFCAGFDLAQTIPLFTGARAPADEWDRAVTTDPAMAGRIPAMGGTATLTRHMPRAIGAEMLLTGEPIDAERALATGFVNRVVEAGAVLATAKEMARTIAGNAPLAVAAARTLLHDSFDLTEAEALARETEAATRLARTADAGVGGEGAESGRLC